MKATDAAVRHGFRRLGRHSPLGLLLGGGLLVLTGCMTVGPDYQPPEPQVNDAWHQDLSEDLSDNAADLRAWWTAFDDGVLNALIQRCHEGNLDLKVAAARIAQAHAGTAVASGGLYPQVQGVGSLTRRRVSEDYLPPTVMQNRTDWYGMLGLDASWEVDVWGRIRRAVEAAEASHAATVEMYRDALVMLYGNVAMTYLELRTVQTRLEVARRNVLIQRESLDLARNRYTAELVPELDVKQAELNLASTEATIPQLEAARVQLMNRLAVLSGQMPGALDELLFPPEGFPEFPGPILVGIPANLLRQRPDIRAAERRLAAETARLGVAKADLYPQFSLSGTFAFDGVEDIFSPGRRSWSFGPAMRWNLFTGGRVRGRVRQQRARIDEAFAGYRRTVLYAVKEVEDALSATMRERTRMETLGRAVSSAEDAVTMVSDLYRAGLTNFQNVLDTQRSLFLQQDQLAQSRGRALVHAVQIYRALGGGWSMEDGPSDVPD